MKLLAAMMALACAAGATGAMAQNPLIAPMPGKAAYNTAMQGAGAQYKTARAACNELNGYLKDVCVAEANAARVRVEADATAQYKNTLKAHTKARIDIAEADYEVNKARCGNKAGNDKDVCQKLAKATRVAAVADANADRKVMDARMDASAAKRDAEYNLALQRCDAVAGNTKQACVAEAKAMFGR
ncbi:MAG TPA: hypothetical protein VIT92_08885 [Burkholderiaceae bacterium]